MKASILKTPGPAENLTLENVQDPVAGPGEAVVRLRAAALNHRDVWIRSGTGAYAGGFKHRVILGLRRRGRGGVGGEWWSGVARRAGGRHQSESRLGRGRPRAGSELPYSRTPG